jgi:hypothetical protein
VKWVALIILLAACRKETAQVVDAGAVAAAPAPGELELTPAKLDGYLRYLTFGLGDGGAPVDRARRDEAALKASGLTEKEVIKLDEMVSTVIARRMVTQLGESPQLNPDLAAMAGALNPEQKKQLGDAMAAFKAQQAAARELTEERKRYGSKNIDALLTREAELTQAWMAMLGMGGTFK